ncbi:MAG: M23 family metallopeptidase, partial [Ilumatobacter sp.]|uniref:M23 family metallopeptidase n=1 Tax=Ilumatobacter sp. TaxID=1967498 RepID=UPI0032978C7F
PTPTAQPPTDQTSTDPALTDTVVEAPVELLAACPVDAPATFEDSWGWPRSGGRSHEGVDMIADRGAPVIAVRDGDALFKRNSLGGNAVWLTAANGDKFYYAHLDGFAGESRTVEAGDVIGFVGSTGNARGPHLHFETLPAGNVENPYPHTVAACVPTLDEVAAIFEAGANALNDPTVWERFIPAS